MIIHINGSFQVATSFHPLQFVFPLKYRLRSWSITPHRYQLSSYLVGFEISRLMLKRGGRQCSEHSMQEPPHPLATAPAWHSSDRGGKESCQSTACGLKRWRDEQEILSSPCSFQCLWWHALGQGGRKFYLSLGQRGIHNWLCTDSKSTL